MLQTNPVAPPEIAREGDLLRLQVRRDVSDLIEDF
jgi:hypothetical protein